MLNYFKSVKAKMGLGFGIIVILVLVLGVTSLWTLTRLDTSESVMFRKNLRGLQDLSVVNTLLAQTEAEALRMLKSRSGEGVKHMNAFFQNANQHIEERFKDYYPERIEKKSQGPQTKQAIAAYQQLVAAMKQFIGLAQGGYYDEAGTYYQAHINAPFQALKNELRQLADSQVSVAEKADKASSQMAYRTELFVSALMGLVLLLIVLTTIWLSRMITIPLSRASAVVASISEGKLDNEIVSSSRDEFGVMLAALSAMQRRLSDVVRQVRDSSDSVAAGAGQIARGNDELSTRTQQQAASLEETAASMEQMTSTVKQNAENAAQADQLSREVGRQARHGSEVVGRAVTAMDEISASSHKIADIVGLIDDIAFQTNLLALNASVEAARAGEQGRGFAVVATEVRNLASRSAAAAKDIKGLVEESSAKVSDGAKEVSLSGQALDEIFESITKVGDLVSEMASASKEQAEGISQVNTAVNQMDSVTQENASLVEESAAASNSLEEQARALKAQMAFFRIVSASGRPTKNAARRLEATEPTEPARDQVAKQPQRGTEKDATAASAQSVEMADGDDDNWTSF